MTHATAHSIPRLGITGGIGAGKSTALAYLRELGAAVISSDDIVHALYERPEVVDAVARRYGEDAVVDGRVDRQALARAAFSDEIELSWLEALLHPYVRAAIDEWACACERCDPRPALLAVEVPVLFEAGLADDFDATMVITAPVEVRRQRLQAKFTAEDFTRRLARQLPEAEKIERSTYSYVNVGSRRHLREFLSETVARILSSTGNDEEVVL